MPLTKNKRDKLKKDAEKLWITSPAKALRLLAKIAKIRKKNIPKILRLTRVIYTVIFLIRLTIYVYIYLDI
jgi:hypothetical protein